MMHRRFLLLAILSALILALPLLAQDSSGVRMVARLFNNWSPACGVAMEGEYAYVETWTSGLRIIDISHPSSPREIGYYDTPGDAQDVAAAGGCVYVADGVAGLRAMDISNPEESHLVGFYDTQ